MHITYLNSYIVRLLVYVPYLLVILVGFALFFSVCFWDFLLALFLAYAIYGQLEIYISANLLKMSVCPSVCLSVDKIRVPPTFLLQVHRIDFKFGM